MTTIQKYNIKNLSCANCAATIEEEIQKLPGVNFASINFATSKLHIDAEDLEIVRDTIFQIEPELEIVMGDEPTRGLEPKARRELALIIGALLLMAGGLIYEDALSQTPFQWGLYLVFGLAYALSGAKVVSNAIRNILKKNWFDETFLMTVSTIGAILIGEMPEAVGVMVFFQVGEFVQQRSVDRSRRSIEQLLDVRPDRASVINGDEVRTVSPEDVRVGDWLVVRPGEKIPLDGIVREGQSQIDTSALTGESVPVAVEVGQEVLAGTINQTGLLKVEVSRVFEQSSVSKLLDLVQNASAKKARTERFITRFAKVYSPIMVGIALVVAFLPPLILPGARLSEWVYRALVVLVVSCPCALVISIPLGYFGGVGGASRRGILVKGANFLDVLADVKTVVVDKTGTLTRGLFGVTEIKPYNGWGEAELLRLAAQVEAQSNHPVARAIMRAYGERPENYQLEGYEELSGHGVKARVNGKLVIAGNDAILHREGIFHWTCDVPGTVVHVAEDGGYAGYIVVSDEVKKEAKKAVGELHQTGVERVVMLSGDRKDVAGRVARELGLDEHQAELLPEDKVRIMEGMMAESRAGKVAFVGDGINDAPALSRADVGISMGALGSDAAIETADVVLMNDSLMKISEAIQVGRRTRKIVRQNIGLALGIKAVFVVLGIFGIATMWEAVIGDVGVTLLAVFNATRVLK